jgi:hypothetical protein
MRDERVFIVDELPRSSLGKVLKGALCDKAGSFTEVSSPQAETRRV